MFLDISSNSFFGCFISVVAFSIPSPAVLKCYRVMKLEVFFSLDTCFIRFTLQLIILCVSSVQSELYSLFSCWYQRSEPIRDRITRNLPRNFTEYPDCEQSAEGCRYNLCVNNIAVLVILTVFTLPLQGNKTWSTTHLDESIRTCYLVKGEEWKTDIW